MGKSLYEMFETSADASNEGQWFNFGPGPLGCDQKFLVARAHKSNVKYSAAFRRMDEIYGQQMSSGTIAEEVAEAAMLDIFCETLLMDWEGVAGRDGVALPFSVSAAKQLMSDLPDLMAHLQELASTREHYLAKQLAVDSGN